MQSKFWRCIPDLHLQRCAEEREVRMLVLGDSKTTSRPNFTEHEALSTVGAFERQMVLQNPHLNVRMKTWAIGGTRSNHFSPTNYATMADLEAAIGTIPWLAAAETETGLSKSTSGILDFVKLAFDGTDEPTLIVFAWGENEREVLANSGYQDLRYQIEQDATLSKCDIAVITNPLPNLFHASMADQSSDATRETERHRCNFAGGYYRTDALYNNDLLIDANAASNAMISGVDLWHSEFDDSVDAATVSMPWGAGETTEGDFGLSITFDTTGISFQDLNPISGGETAGLKIPLGPTGANCETFLKFTTDASGDWEVTAVALSDFVGANGRYDKTSTGIAAPAASTVTVDVWWRGHVCVVDIDGTRVLNKTFIAPGGRWTPSASIITGETPSVTLSYWKGTNRRISPDVKFHQVYYGDADDANQQNHEAPLGVQIVYEDIFREIPLTVPTGVLAGGILESGATLPSIAPGGSHEIPIAINDGLFRLGGDNANLRALVDFDTVGPNVTSIQAGATIEVDTAATMAAATAPTASKFKITVAGDGIKLQSDAGVGATLATGYWSAQGR